MRGRVCDFLFKRAAAYRSVFRPEGPHTRRVLADLALFCRANEPTFHKDARVEGILQGRREVWLRIQQHLNLSDGELWALFSGGKPLSVQTEQED